MPAEVLHFASLLIKKGLYVPACPELPPSPFPAEDWDKESHPSFLPSPYWRAQLLPGESSAAELLNSRPHLPNWLTDVAQIQVSSHFFVKRRLKMGSQKALVFLFFSGFCLLFVFVFSFRTEVTFASSVYQPQKSPKRQAPELYFRCFSELCAFCICFIHSEDSITFF